MRPDEFGVFLAAQRKRNNMTQSQLAESVCVTVSAVSKWERGKCLPDISKLDAIAEVLGLTVCELLNCAEAQAGDAPDRACTPDREKRLLEEIRILQAEEAKRRTKRWILAALAAVFLTVGIFFLKRQIGNMEVPKDGEVIIDIALPDELEEIYGKTSESYAGMGILAFLLLAFLGGAMMVYPGVFWQLRYFFDRKGELEEAPYGYATVTRICGVIILSAGVFCLLVGCFGL